MEQTIELQTRPDALKRRRHSRYTGESPVLLKITPNGEVLKGWVRNASLGGMSVEITENPQALKLGDEVDVTWDLPLVLDGDGGPPSCTLPGTIVRRELVPGRLSTIQGIRFLRTIPEVRKESRRGLSKALIACALLIVASCILALKARNAAFFWYRPMLQIYSIAAATYILSRALLSLFYKEPKDRGLMLPVSIIITAKNEEAHIAETVHRCFKSNYPRDLMELIVIDDGSDDKTWDVLTRLRPEYPEMKLIQFEKNKGKRHAMAAGAEQAKGDILIYVDSDSYVDAEGIYKIVQPFANPKVGAVSGHILAVVEPHNTISKMESVRYYVAHRLMKAVESIYGAVTCCPGAFSAYRRSAVMDVLEPWLNQTFLGAQATFGDDRSLTNHILKRYRVLYHSGAICETYVPDTWHKFFRQQLRWKKSWARETTVAARLMWKKHPVAAISYYISVLLTILSPLVALNALLLPLHTSLGPWHYLAGVFLVYLFMCLMFLYYRGERHWLYGMVFAFLYIFVLSFQNYYAFFTVRRNHWGTR